MECNRKIQKLSISADDGFLLVEIWMEQLDQEDLNIVACVARRIWLRRNSIVFDGPLSSLALLVQSTTAALEAFHQAKKESGPMTSF